MGFDDGQLIELGQQFPVIYDKKHKHHKVKQVLENSFTTIGEVMGFAADVCQQRWTNIRNRYAKERRAIVNVASGSEDTIITWPYYHQCGFLDSVVIPRKTTGNVTKNNYKTSTSLPGCSGTQRNADSVWSSYTEIVSGLSQSDAASEKISEEEGSESFTNTGEEEDVTLVSQNEEEEVVEQRQKISEMRQKAPKKKGKDSDALENLTKTISGVFERMETLITDSPIEDKDDEELPFARSVASSLKNIRSIKKRLITKS